MAIVVLAVLGALLAPLLVNSFRAYEVNQSNLVTLSKLRYATERIAREVREVFHNGTNYAIVAPLSPTTLSFTKGTTAGPVVTITGAPPVVSLQYSVPNVTAVLTDQVAAGGLQFQYFDINDSDVGVTNVNVAYIDVVLTLTDPNSGAVTQRTRIALRNAP